MNYLKKSKLFYITTLLISCFLLWDIVKNIDILVQIITTGFNVLLIPFIITLFLYYILKPLYLFFRTHLKNDSISLLFTLFILLGIIYFLIRDFIPLILSQIESLINFLPQMVQEIDQRIIDSKLLEGNQLDNSLNFINTYYENYIQFFFITLRSGTSLLLSFISKSFLVISIVPVMLIYMLKNSNKPKEFQKVFPIKYQSIAYEYFVDLEKTLSDYISGKSLVCLYVFFGAWLIFSIAGLEGALLFAVVCGIMDVIPYVGPWIGTIPAIIAATIGSNVNPFIIIIGIIIVQLGETYIVSPYIMSKELSLHPLFIIISMLITGKTFGILGMIVIIPLIATIKVTVIHVIKIRKNLKSEDIYQ